MALISINPFTGETIKEHTPFSAQKIEEKVFEAENAFSEWKYIPIEKRSVYFTKLAHYLRENTAKYAQMITLEMGKSYSESQAEINKCAWVCDYYAENTAKFLAEEKIETDGTESMVWYEPLGIILGVMPWNFPFWQVFRFAAPTIMAGNTVLLKHASNVQGCSALIEEAFLEAGLPSGVFGSLLIESKQVESVLDYPSVKAVSLTGSETAGSIVAAQAARRIKKSVLELGGNNPFIVLDDADLDSAISVGIQARMQNGGQSCIAAKRFLVSKKIASPFIEQVKEKLNSLSMGDPMDDKTDIGPLASVEQAKIIEDQVKRSVERGAKIITGGNRNQAFFEPTLLTGVKPGMPAFDEETFGPVLAFAEFNTEKEAIDLANNSTFGLGVSIFTKDVKKAKKLARDIEDGAVFINALVKSDPRLPFGGTKRSGFGRELSHHGIKEFVNIKTIYLR